MAWKLTDTLGKPADYQRSPGYLCRMDIARWSPLALGVFLFRASCLGIFNLIGNIGIAIGFARVDVQEFFRSTGAGQLPDELASSIQPAAHVQFAADVCKSVFKGIRVPHANAKSSL